MPAADANAITTSARPMTGPELRAVFLETLGVLDEFCRAAGLRYFFWAGTLLGAVRHRGVIPWDDDLDLAMPRSDYERFCREFGRSLPENLELFTMETRPEYGYPFAR